MGVHSVGTGGSYRRSILKKFPQTYDNIEIKGSCTMYGNAFPTSSYLFRSMMWGQVDIGFVAGEK